jgi:hypothetical protein
MNSYQMVFFGGHSILFILFYFGFPKKRVDKICVLVMSLYLSFLVFLFSFSNSFVIVNEKLNIFFKDFLHII